MRNTVFGSATAIIAACLCVHAVAQSTPTGANDSTAAQAQLTRVDTSATLAKNQPVVIDNPYGDVRLRFGGYEHAVASHAVVQQPNGAAVIVLQPSVVEGHYRIAPRLPEGVRITDDQRLDLVVFVAEGHSVTVRTEQGQIESRGIRADIDLQSTSGNIAIRGTQGSVQARTAGSGSVEASLGPAPAGSTQRLATRTGTIILAVDEKLDAELQMSTSAAFATEYSLQVEQLPGKEPNKTAKTTIGVARATIILQSLRGEIRLLRWNGFTAADASSSEEKQVKGDSN
ncbi:hypothetical protein [Dokdonella sp.]|uniref:hypothetical protein n=1 Tax=Dokdonella sp. TaxID=2291710 RepID=UPI003C4A857A